MIRRRLSQYRDRCRQKLLDAFREEHTPHQIGASFGIGIFITALPTGGLGIGLFFVFASLWSWISKPAIFASVAVLNPFVKPAVYVASFQVGGVLLGPKSIQSGETRVESIGIGLYQLLLGNLVVAVCLSIIGYFVVARLTRLHRQQEADDSFVSMLAEPFRFRRR